MRGEGQFIRGTIRYKKIVYLILFLMIAVGIYGLASINKDEFPTFEIKEGLVVGVYPGASASEVESQLTRPLEDLLFSFAERNKAFEEYEKQRANGVNALIAYNPNTTQEPYNNQFSTNRYSESNTLYVYGNPDAVFMMPDIYAENATA